MSTIWRKGGLVLFGLIFVLSLSIASFLSIVPTKVAVAGPIPFRGSYYNNMTLSGTPVLTCLDTTINFDWGPVRLTRKSLQTNSLRGGRGPLSSRKQCTTSS